MSRRKPLIQHEINNHLGHRNIKPDRDSEFAHFSMTIKSMGGRSKMLIHSGVSAFFTVISAALRPPAQPGRPKPHLLVSAKYQTAEAK
jgi:hypothetical protein